MNEHATPEAILKAWIEQNVGEVVRLERQGRWRPAWFVDVKKDGQVLPLYVRGARADTIAQPQPLSFECEVFKVFGAGGVRTPKVYGFIEELPAIVMSLEPGGPDLSSASPAEYEAIWKQLVEQMLLIHQVDPAAMEQAGSPRPATADELGLAYYRRIEPLYLKGKCRPEPIIEFLRGWIDRNKPEQPNVAYPITVDAGQFIFEGDRLTAMLDFEFSALGDYHVDLAANRLRDLIEDVGDLNPMYRLYGELSGTPVDYHRIRYHTVVKGVLPPMHMAGPIGSGTATDYVQYMCWHVTWLRMGLEAVAEIKGWAMDPFTAPEPAPAGRFGLVNGLLEADLVKETVVDEVADYQRKRRLRLVRFQGKLDLYGAELERRYLDDVEKVLGRRPADAAQADAALEAHVVASDGSDDEALVRLFWRQLKGQSLLLADPTDAVNYESLTISLPPVGPDL